MLDKSPLIKGGDFLLLVAPFESCLKFVARNHMGGCEVDLRFIFSQETICFNH